MFLLAGDKFMTEMDLRQPELTYSACGSFTKSKEGIRKLKETEDSQCTYQNELDNACFQHDMVCGDFKDLSRRYLILLKSEIQWISKGSYLNGL